MLAQDTQPADFFGPPLMTNKIVITVFGEPVPKGRPRVRMMKNKYTGKFGPMLYTPPETEKYEDIIRRAARKAIGDDAAPIETSCEMVVRVYLPVPESWSNKKKLAALSGVVRPTSRPDSDNYLKAAADALNGIVYKDDGQVIDMHVSKFYSETPRLEIEVRA